MICPADRSVVAENYISSFPLEIGACWCVSVVLVVYYFDCGHSKWAQVFGSYSSKAVVTKSRWEAPIQTVRPLT